MSSTPQPQPQPPPSPSPLYTALTTTAHAFIAAQAQDDSLPTRVDFGLMRTLCSPAFTHAFGHKHAVSMSPALQGTLSLDGFVAHLQAMLPRLARWRAEVRDTVVDTAALRVVLRISFLMTPRGGGDKGEGEGEGETVENDVVWLLDMECVEEGGRGERVTVRIKKSVEFVDGVAAARLREGMLSGAAAAAVEG